MRNQRKHFGLWSIIVCMLVLVTLTCCLSVTSFADTDARPEVKVSDIVFNEANTAELEGITYYTKVYDATDKFVGTIGFATSFNDAPFDDPDVKIVIDEEKLYLTTDSAEAENELHVSFMLVGGNAREYTHLCPKGITIPAKVTRKVLTWKDTVDPYVNTDFSYTAEGYEFAEVEELGEDDAITKTALAEYIKKNLEGLIANDEITIDEKIVAKLDKVAKPGSYTAVAEVELENYTVEPLEIRAMINKLSISNIEWNHNGGEYVHKDEAVYNIEANVKDSGGKTYPVKVSYLQKNEEGEWEPVERISGDKGEYKIYIAPFNDFVFVPAWDDEEKGASVTTSLAITHIKYKVAMPNATYIGDQDLITGENATKFYIRVNALNKDIPLEILNQIRYVVNGKPFDGTAEYGETVVTAILPVSANDEYGFYNASGKQIKQLTGTIVINRLYVTGGCEEGRYDVFVMNEGLGFAENVTAEVTLPEFDKNVLRGFPIHSEFTLELKGDIPRNDKFVLYIPHYEKFSSKNIAAFTADDLYVYNAEENKLVKANELYTVVMQDGYFRVEGVSDVTSITFVTAPAYDTPFFLTAPGLALIALFVICVVLVLYYVGMKRRRAVADQENETVVVDTDGKDVDEDLTVLLNASPAFSRVNVDDLIAEIQAEEAAKISEEEAAIISELTRGAVEDTLQTLTNEASKILLPHEDLSLAENTTNELATRLFDELNDTVEADDGVRYAAEEEELNAAVAEVMTQVFNESADATDAIALIVDEVPAEEELATVESVEAAEVAETVEVDETVETAEAAEIIEDAVAVEVDEAVAVVEAVEAEEEEDTGITPEDFRAVVDSIVEKAISRTIILPEKMIVDESDENEIVENQDDVCAIVADSVAKAFDRITVDGVMPQTVEGVNEQMIAEVVSDAAEGSIPEGWTEEMAVAVKAAIVDELVARLVSEAVEEVLDEAPEIEDVEAEAVEVFVENAEQVEPVDADESVEDSDDEDDDDSDDDADDSDDDDKDTDKGDKTVSGDKKAPFKFSTKGLSFVDVNADPDAYQALLEQERQGLIKIEYRYRRSFTSRVAQSEGKVQDYYSEIKNLLLSYKGVKGRMSQRYEAFGRGRSPIVRMDAKAKTLYLYLALNPAEIPSKYGVKDVSSKKKYASVPALLKVKGERKFKYAMELIEKICSDNLGLQPVKHFKKVDYRMKNQSNEDLVAAGHMKMLAAAVPVDSEQ